MTELKRKALNEVSELINHAIAKVVSMPIDNIRDETLKFLIGAQQWLTAVLSDSETCK